MNKKILILVAFLVFFAPLGMGLLVVHAAGDTTSAPGFVPIAGQGVPGLTDSATANSADTLATFFNNLYKYLVGMAAILAIIEIIRGGLEIATKDSVSKQADGKEHITQAIYGLLLILSPVLVFYIINPTILNLSVALPNLDTANTSLPGGPGTPTQSGTVVSNTGVTQTVQGTYFKLATFSSNDVAANNDALNSWLTTCSKLSSSADPGASLSAIKQLSSCATKNTTASGGSTCATATQGIAWCATRSMDSFVFTDISGTFSLSKKLRPLTPNDSAGVTNFQSACATDTNGAGVSCIAGGTYHSLSQCPTPPQNIPAGASGNCYEAKLFCYPDKAAASSDGIHCTPGPTIVN